MHAGYPLKDQMMALMAAQVYAEFGFLTAGYRDSDIWTYLRAFIDAGFETASSTGPTRWCGRTSSTRASRVSGKLLASARR